METKKLSKKGDLARRLRSFVKHVLLILQPTLLSALVSYLWWRFIFSKGVHFSKEDENPLLAGVVLVLSFAYVITATAVFQTTWDKYRTVMQSVLKRDKYTFLCYRDERMPIVVHLLIFFFSAPLFGVIALLNYSTFDAGLYAVATTSFGFTLYWVVVTELQDPRKSLWFSERIPKDWLTADIDAFFKLAEDGTSKDTPAV